jgi:hypothetical protein
VSHLAELLELMHTSTTRWQTIRARGWEWRHLVRLQDAWRRMIPRDRSRGIAISSGSEQPTPEDVREPWRLWRAQPDRVRTEFTVGDDTVTAVIVGETWWSWSRSRTVTTNRGDPHSSHGRGPGDALLHPASILPAVELDVAGPIIFIGRPALEVVATPSPIDDNDEESSDWRFATHHLGGGADEYALLVDAQRGVLLRSEARIGGEPFRIIEMAAVAFDEALAEDVFAPPPDRDIQSTTSPRSVSLIELPDAVSFTVLVPESPPFGADDVDLHPADPRHGMPEQIHIAYASQFFGEDDRYFWLVEAAETIREPAAEWRDAEGMRFGEDRAKNPPLRIVQLERLGTHVEVRSYSLQMEELLDLARSLVPLRKDPPPLRAMPP